MSDHPEFIDRYRIDGLLATLGAEVLYAAFDGKLHRPVALRALFRSKLDEESFAQGVAGHRKTVAVDARLSHPGILRVLEIGESAGIAYLVTERLPGKSLRARFEKRARFEPARASAIIERLLEVLAHVHEAGIIHRNIHAGCVIVDDDDSVRLSDFDLARLPPGDPASAAAGSAGRISGKVALMAPEQITGGEIDERTDLFHVGVLLYRLLTGIAPFSANGALALAKQIMQEHPPAPSQIEPTILRGFDQVVRVALEKCSERRFASAREFSFYLRWALERKPEKVGAHHVLAASLDIGEAGPDGEPWPDQTYDDMLKLAVELQNVCAAHGATCGKTVGNDLFCCFPFSDRVVAAMQACRAHFARSLVAARYGAHLRALVHHGIVVTSGLDAFGDNIGLAHVMLTECTDEGVFFSAPAAAALPESDRVALRLSSVGFERFTRNANVSHLVRSSQVFALA